MKISSLLYFLINCNAILLCLLGASVILGWYLQIPELIQVSRNLVPMQFNTALGFIVAGMAMLWIPHQPKISTVCAIFLILLGGLTLSQYLFQVNFGIDQLLFKHYITVRTSHPGRMAPNTALNFLLTGFSILFLTQTKIRHHLSYAGCLGALMMGLGTVSLCGYIYQVETAYGWGKLTSMAAHSSVGFILLGFTLILEIQYVCKLKKYRLPSTFWALNLMIFGLTMTLSLWQALYATSLFDSTDARDIYLKQLVGNGILFLGGLLSVVLAIAVWLARRFYEQVKELKLAQKKILSLNRNLEKLSYLDGLTGIANRRCFDLTFEKEWSRACRYQEPLMLMIIDIDYFKNYNDFYGHQQGDACIKQVAQTLASLARRKTDLTARYGGEEFVLLMTNVNHGNAPAIAEHVHQTLLDLKIPHGASPTSEYLTVSLGYNVIVPTPDADPEQFLREADKALYQAKEQGRNQVVVWQSVNH